MRNRTERNRKGCGLVQRLFAGVALIALAGCVSAAKDEVLLGEAGVTDPATATSAQNKAQQKNASGYVDPMVANVSDAAPAGDPGDPMLAANDTAPADLGELMMQSTGIDAGRSSIFSAYQPTASDGAPVAPETAASLVPSGLPQQRVNAVAGSLFSTANRQQQPVYPPAPQAEDE